MRILVGFESAVNPELQPVSDNSPMVGGKSGSNYKQGELNEAPLIMVLLYYLRL